MLFRSHVLKRTVKLDFHISQMIVKPLIVTILMAVISYAGYKGILILGISSTIATMIGIIIAVLVYTMFVILFKILSKEDIYMLPSGDKIYHFLQKLRIYR